MLFEVPCRDKIDAWTSLWAAQAKRPSCITSSPWFSFLQNTSNNTYIFFFSLRTFSQRQSRSQLLSSHWNVKQVYKSKCPVLFLEKNAVSVSLFQFLDLFHQDFMAPMMSQICAHEDCEFSSLFNIFLILHIAILDIQLYSVCPITHSLVFLVLFTNHFPMEIVNKVLITAKWRV